MVCACSLRFLIFVLCACVRLSLWFLVVRVNVPSRLCVFFVFHAGVRLCVRVFCAFLLLCARVRVSSRRFRLSRVCFASACVVA